MQRNPAKPCMCLGRRGAQGLMKTAAGCLRVRLQSLPIERDENFGKLRRSHIPKALQPCPEVAAVPLLLCPLCSRGGRGVPGGSRSPGDRSRWPRARPAGGSLLRAAALFRSQFCCVV